MVNIGRGRRKTAFKAIPVAVSNILIAWTMIMHIIDINNNCTDSLG